MRHNERGVVYLLVAGLMCSASSTWAQERSAEDQQRISALIAEMRTADLPNMKAITIEPYKMPTASVDVMRVRLEETYDVKGVGKDTVPLYGWIAVTHDNARPIKGQTEARWGTSTSKTQFVAMDLHGDSKIFGPVHVQLSPGAAAIGQVGNLTMGLVDRVVTDIAYMPYRPAQPQNAVLARATPLPLPELPAHLSLASAGDTPGEAAVKQTLFGVLSAISDKNADAMTNYYSKDKQDVFYNGTLSPSAQGVEEYRAELTRMFANVKTIHSVADDNSLRIRVSGALAVASLTGQNDIVDNAGNRFSAAWAWSVQLEKAKTGWLITHDQLAFSRDAASDACNDKVIRAACACAAGASVDINMSKLNLNMETDHPVMWYSEVKTIPPTGATASVSFSPTPLNMDGRQVATLTSGVVKFREVVRRVKLDGTQPGDRIASR